MIVLKPASCVLLLCTTVMSGCFEVHEIPLSPQYQPLWAGREIARGEVRIVWGPCPSGLPEVLWRGPWCTTVRADKVVDELLASGFRPDAVNVDLLTAQEIVRAQPELCDWSRADALRVLDGQRLWESREATEASDSDATSKSATRRAIVVARRVDTLVCIHPTVVVSSSIPPPGVALELDGWTGGPVERAEYPGTFHTELGRVRLGLMGLRSGTAVPDAGGLLWSCPTIGVTLAPLELDAWGCTTLRIRSMSLVLQRDGDCIRVAGAGE